MQAFERESAEYLGVHVYHQYTILSDRRDRIMQSLQDARIACAIYYPVPLHRQKVFAPECEGVNLPVTQQVAAQCLSLPIYPELEEAQVRRIAEVIRAAVNH